MPIPTLHTERLTLRPFCPEDTQTLFAINQQEGVLQYFPNPQPPRMDQVQRFVQHLTGHWEKHGYGNWAVTCKGEQEMIGWTGLEYLTELDETEVGFLFARLAWGQGFATEAAQASLHFAFEQCRLDHIIALVHPDNLASRRVLEKCGLTYVETLPLWGLDLMRYRIEKPVDE
jgi:ribosomal-protein-alanine N-acetyltransferase